MKRNTSHPEAERPSSHAWGRRAVTEAALRPAQGTWAMSAAAIIAAAAAAMACGGEPSAGTRCDDNNGGCGDPARITCVSTAGAMATCVDVDECATDNGGCGAPESFSCVNNDDAAPTCVPVPTITATGLRSDAPPFAVHGPFWVGFRQMEIAAGEGGKAPLTVKIWYPALNPARAAEKITYHGIWKLLGVGLQIDDPVAYGHAIADAPIDATRGKRAVVVFSHGYAMNPEWYSTLLEHYASQGLVVLAPEHIETDWFEAWAASVDRPHDVERTLDFAEALTAPGGAFAGALDTSKVAVVGHSFGGYTALAMAGARLDLEALTARCATLPPEDLETMLTCTPFLGKEAELAARRGLSSVPQGLWPSLGDARIKAILPMAGDAYMFGEAGLASVTVPVMAMGGTADWGTPWHVGAQLAYDHVGSVAKTLVAIEGAGHMIAIAPCESLPWTEALRPTGYYETFCMDSVWDKLRVLDLINHFSTAFLLDVLTNDSAAHQALCSAEAVFPGIGFTTTVR